MKAEDKAKELVNKYLDYMPSIYEYYHEHVPDHDSAKECAIIAVDEILKPISVKTGINFTTVNPSYAQEKYWKEVKKEIELLRT